MHDSLFHSESYVVSVMERFSWIFRLTCKKYFEGTGRKEKKHGAIATRFEKEEEKKEG